MNKAHPATPFEKVIEIYGIGSRQEILVHWLTDAMHWCHANSEDFHYAYRLAAKHFVAELNDSLTEERKLP